MKGVILTAGAATRLRPITNTYGKVLVPIYNKPMIFYGISLMIKCGIKDICLVCNKSDIGLYQHLFSNIFSDCGVNIGLVIQEQALGTANAVKYAKNFVGDDDFVLLFGDNIFVMDGMEQVLADAIKNNTGLTMFAKAVEDPERFGVIEYDENFNVTKMEEKPANPKTNIASTGLYVYSNEAMKQIDDIKLSPRGEYEMTDIISDYVNNKKAKVKIFDASCHWLDTGTFDALLECSQLVCEFEKQHGLFACLELDLLKQGFINKEKFEELIKKYSADYKQKIYNTLSLWEQKENN